MLTRYIRQFLTYIPFTVSILVFSQAEQNNNTSYIDVNYFKGNIALHNKDILRLIINRPEGFVLSWNKKTFGDKTWEQRYNYPDYGVSFTYQDFGNPILGINYGIHAHYNFYFLKRSLIFRIGQGIAYATNPFDKIENPRNIAFGSDILSSTYVLLNYKKENLIDRFGLQAGLALTHYSNGSIKAPNTSINTIALNIGVTYNLDEENLEYIKNEGPKEKYTEPLKYNIAFRSGVNQSDVVGTNQFPFYIFSGYIDKRLTRKSAIQFGADVFFSRFLKELIQFESVAFPENNVDLNTDYKRAGLFIGHELFINKLSIISQLGYYVYYPFDFEGRTYSRIGLKYYFGKKWFGAVTLKSHAANAEAIEFGIGVRL
ncbi:acyloxyacyl hydrolase [Flavobacteriaceae bacterium AU392]|nr:acyloxyacyl hydrolase [Flavobacteriaceae bacterium]RKM81529.1 acyloxyacyl hydrolase [Flavobacteriaceae bacterium AU392]